MENVSIKLLNALFDFCEGENYVILDKQDFLARVSDHDFATDELTEILEALSVEGFIDLKYADNQEFCIAMKTKGRTLIKQAREKMQHILKEEPIMSQDSAPIADEDKDNAAPESGQAIPAEEPAEYPLSDDASSVLEDLESSLNGANAASQSHARRGGTEEHGYHFSDVNRQARGYATSSAEEGEHRESRRNAKSPFWPAFLGATIGSILIDVIFLIIFLVKFGQ